MEINPLRFREADRTSRFCPRCQTIKPDVGLQDISRLLRMVRWWCVGGALVQLFQMLPVSAGPTLVRSSPEALGTVLVPVLEAAGQLTVRMKQIKLMWAVFTRIVGSQ